nr:uncharacterized protein CTRU02_11699 [Colletotrichum truncatum]KAF6785714.1 hypothetical protein CTRU02_11699 [Colletotrichum truncatum]
MLSDLNTNMMAVGYTRSEPRPPFIRYVALAKCCLLSPLANSSQPPLPPFLDTTRLSIDFMYYKKAFGITFRQADISGLRHWIPGMEDQGGGGHDLNELYN